MTSLELVNSSTFTLVALATLAWASFAILRRALKRSPYNGINGPPSTSILGYRLDVNNPDGFHWHAHMTENYGHIVRLRGNVIQDDGLFITDPKALQTILIREQKNFDETDELRGGTNVSTVSVSGKEHKNLRRIIDPAVTSANISKLFPVFYEIGDQFMNSIDVTAGEGSTNIDIIQFLSRSTLEFIGRGGLGHSFRSFEKDSAEYIIFHSAIHALFPTMTRLFFIFPFFESWRNMRPVRLRKALYNAIDYLPWPSARKFKHLIDTMHSTYHDIYNDKKRAFEKGVLDEDVKDMTSLSFKTNASLPESEKFSDQLVISSMSVLTLGGQETTTGALSRHILMLAQHPEEQQKIRDEIKGAAEALGRDFTYEELNALPYLDCFVKEVLRLYPPVPFLWRTTKQDTIVPLEFPIENLGSNSTMDKILITKGTTICIGIAAANRSSRIYGPNAHDFKPERWLQPDGGQLKTYGAYSNTYTFLAGSRACPGMRFAVIEIKLILFVLLRKYALSVTNDEIEWKMGGITFTPYVKGDDIHPCAPVKLTRLPEH
ncbi:hypothetical protein D9758_016232 [Tetrapyrgos nigripes]|uniref:Cytochrome P450 n=1 Tax=Tetrapyrgos nigripes TaxID=182062 RepID=A0A8H5FG71_9AGAR|nr:hypothetical protein D9758_016232 [Tetrapyrgos nigripes]